MLFSGQVVRIGSGHQIYYHQEKCHSIYPGLFVGISKGKAFASQWNIYFLFKSKWPTKARTKTQTNPNNLLELFSATPPLTPNLPSWKIIYFSGACALLFEIESESKFPRNIDIFYAKIFRNIYYYNNDSIQ